MELLQFVIGNLSKEELRNFKLLAKRTNDSSDRKDLQLFDYIKNQYPNYNEDVIQQKLYNNSDKNSLYRLKNRLIEDVGKSLSLLHFNDTDIHDILTTLLLAHIFKSKSQEKITFYYLERAERKARQIDHLHLLELIYNEFIQLSHETLEVNPEEYIQKRKEVRSKITSVQEIDDLLAAVIYRVKTTQNFSKKNIEVVGLLEKTVNEFSNKTEYLRNPQLRFKIYDAVSRILLQREDYPALEKYLLKTYADFSHEKLFNKNNHDTKLQLLTYLINSLFKNNKISESLKYAGELKKAMLDYDGMLHDKYLFYYYNALVINYSKINIDKTIEILHEAQQNKVIKRLPVYEVFIYLNLAVANFEKKNYKEALRNLIRPSISDSFQKLDVGFRYKLSIAEMIIRYELNDTDFIERRIPQIKKEFKEEYLAKAYKREHLFIDILSKLIYTGSNESNSQIKESVKALLKLKSSGENDIINYNSWLKSKLKV